MKKIIIAYHAYLYGDNYMSIIGEQFSTLLSSQLYKAADKMYIGIIDTPNKKPSHGIDWIRSWWSFGSNKESGSLGKVEIVIYPENKELIDTLKWIKDYAEDNPDDYVCFLHAKGIMHHTKPTEDWRRYMEYFVIENWKDCIKKLKEGFDACGVLWNRDTVYGDYPHFSGCMFWANTSYINTLDHKLLDAKWRYGGEFWIGTGVGKIFEFHNSRMNDKEQFALSASHYSLPYPRERYDKNIPEATLEELNIEDGLFLSDKGCIHHYLNDYDRLFTHLRHKKINIFEVGFQYGGSCRLWEKYFPYAQIRAIDITTARPWQKQAEALGVMTNITTGNRVRREIKDVMTLTAEYFTDFPLDIAIDDGSHILEQQLYFVKLAYPLISRGGILIVEDIQDLDNEELEFLKLGWHFDIIDRRKESGVYDDVIIIYRK